MLRQRVEAAPQRIVRAVPLYNPLHMHASFFLHYSGKRTACKEKAAGVSAGETSAVSHGFQRSKKAFIWFKPGQRRSEKSGYFGFPERRCIACAR